MQAGSGTGCGRQVPAASSSTRAGSATGSGTGRTSRRSRRWVPQARSPSVTWLVAGSRLSLAAAGCTSRPASRTSLRALRVTCRLIRCRTAHDSHQRAKEVRDERHGNPDQSRTAQCDRSLHRLRGGARLGRSTYRGQGLRLRLPARRPRSSLLRRVGIRVEGGTGGAARRLPPRGEAARHLPDEPRRDREGFRAGHPRLAGAPHGRTLRVRGRGHRLPHRAGARQRSTPMTDLATPLLEVDKIEVVEGFNPRTHMDPDALARLAGSLGKTDVVQPLTVRPIDGGKFAVIAGHRRLRAAEMAGIEKVPVHVRDGGDALTAALVENHHREDLDPTDTARGLQALAEELNLSTHKQIAEELEVSG